MSSAVLAARKARASDVPATDMLAEAIAYVRPRLEGANPISDRLRTLWAGVAAARDLAAADVIEAEFLLLARDTRLAADLGCHAETDIRHVIRWAMLDMNPFQ
jgi:hypothetical protein